MIIKILFLFTTLFIVMYGLKRMFTRKPKITVKYNPIPLHQIIEEPKIPNDSLITDLVIQVPLTSVRRTSPYVESDNQELRKLRGDVQRLFAFKNDKQHAIKDMKEKHPLKSEREILELVIIEYSTLYKRG